MPETKSTKRRDSEENETERNDLPVSKKSKLDETDEKNETIGQTVEGDNGKEEVIKADNGNSKTDVKEKSGNGKSEAAKVEEEEDEEEDEEEEVESESVETNAEEPVKGDRDSGPGILLICGGTNWDLIGRKEPPKSLKTASTQSKNLWGPHVWRSDLKVKEIVSSSTACHSVIITEDGLAMVFGRNDKGQLGVGDIKMRSEPTVVESLKKIKMKSAATGKGHTLFLTEDGHVYAVGDNKMGQLGVGSQSNANLTTPAKISYNGKPIVKVACGAEFSMMIDIDGNLFSFGSPEYGQLGHNSEGKYFTTGNKIAYNCETSPRKVVAFIEKTREGHIIPTDNVVIKDVACGINHTLVLDTKNRVFSWGFAGYGRLGHNETKDEFMPRNLKTFDYQGRGANKIFAGGAFSMAVDVNGVLYFWGQTKSSGEATMYPKPVQDLCNWNIRSVGTSNRSIVVAADESVISWGPSPTYGELGYGENKAKSSTTPQEVKILDKIYVKKVTCGYGHTLFLAEDKTTIKQLPKWP